MTSPAPASQREVARDSHLGITVLEHVSSRSIPKGLRPPAQGCEARATLGMRSNITTPTGLRQFWIDLNVQARRSGRNPCQGCACFHILTQGSSFLATLGLVAESRWDSRNGHRALLNRAMLETCATLGSSNLIQKLRRLAGLRRLFKRKCDLKQRRLAVGPAKK